MAINTPKDSLILLPKEILPRLKFASAEELKILIYMFSEPDCLVADAARELGITTDQANAAVAFWRGAGIFTDAAERPKKVTSDTSIYRNYDASDIKNALDTSKDFAMVTTIATNALQKAALTKNDLSALLYLYDFAGVPAPVICGIITDCAENEKANMQYIFKKTISLYEQGIDSYDKLEAYLARRKEINSQIGKLRKLFGMGDRALTAKEKKLFDCWFDEWQFSFEVVKLAYEKTVDNKGAINNNYMNGILKRWYESGYQTVEDIENETAGRSMNVEHSYDLDEFVQAALKRGFDD